MDYEHQLRLQQAINGLISFLVVLFLILAAGFSLFALYDNQRIYQSTRNVQADMLRMKPEEEQGASFQELLALNPDVRGWLTMENTNIDFPILQGESNLTYINQDVYGNFSLAGSIFLDYRNRPDFSDTYELLYGHHMEGSNMFGDLDKYKQESFFRENPEGELILPRGSYDLRAFAVLLVTSSDEVIFSPQSWETDFSDKLAYIRENAQFTDEAILKDLENRQNPRILALTTCSGEFTDARTIVLTEMIEKVVGP